MKRKIQLFCILGICLLVNVTAQRIETVKNEPVDEKRSDLVCQDSLSLSESNKFLLFSLKSVQPTHPGFGNQFVKPLSGKKDTLKIAAVGDVMLGTAYPDSAILLPQNSFLLFRPLQNYLMDADLTFGNLEGVLTNDFSQVKTLKTNRFPYFFAMPTDYSASLKKAGFDVMSVANNHINDFGLVGRKSTKQNLRKQGIRFAGFQECPIDTFTREGVKYGFCAFAPNAGTLSIKDMKRAEQVVRRLNEMVDIVLVSFHAGGEGVEFERVSRKTEFYIGENRGNVYAFAHRMIDAGADVLLGHGPHVTRAVEVYKNRFITYSMGNFCTYSCVSVAGKCGVAPLFHIFTNNKGEFLKARIIPVCQSKYKAPKVDSKKRVINIIRNLTKLDFPEMNSVIRITEDGWIHKI